MKIYSVLAMVVALSVVVIFSASFAQPPISPVDPEKLQKPIPIPKCPDLQATLTHTTTAISGGTGYVNFHVRICNIGTANLDIPEGVHVNEYTSPPLRPSEPEWQKIAIGRYGFSRLAMGRCIETGGSYSYSPFPIHNIVEWGHREPRPGEPICKAERKFKIVVVRVDRRYAHGRELTSREDCNPGNNSAITTVRYMVQCPI